MTSATDTGPEGARQEEVSVPGQSEMREEDDSVARQSDAVSEGAQSVTTEEDAERTATGSLGGTAGAERRDQADDLQTE